MSKLPETKVAKRTPIRKSARRAAEEVGVIHLSPADQRVLIRAILSPPPPGASLRRAALMYRMHIKSSA